jgi:hypothetical protein
MLEKEKNSQQVIFSGCKHWVMFYSVHSCVIISEDSGLGLHPDLINLHLDSSHAASIGPFPDRQNHHKIIIIVASQVLLKYHSTQNSYFFHLFTLSTFISEYLTVQD